jgi:ATP-dependent DNA helicase RecQ
MDALVGAGALRSSPDVYRVLRLTELGREVMAGRQLALTLLVPTVRAKGARGGRKKAPSARRAGTHGSTPSETGPIVEPDADILAALREWRREEARARAVPAFVVLHDKTMGAIASEQPRSLADLEGISGIGPTKLEAYGEKILEVLRSRSPGVQ